MRQKIKDYAMTKKQYLKPFLVYLAISLIMFWQVTINLFGYVVNGHGDVYQSMFNLWWVPYAVFTLHQSPYFTNLLYYPVGASLVTQTLSPLAGIITAPLQFAGSAFVYNVLFFSSFALSGIFMFALANYFVKNRYAAFIAGLIFAFSPMHIAQSYGHLDWTIIEWVPLFLYLYVRTINEHKKRYAFFAALSFVLLTFMGDIEQGIMVFFATVVFTIIYLVIDRAKLLDRKAVVNVGLFIVMTLILSAPFLLAMLPYLSGGSFATAQQNSGVVNNMMWSNNVLSFFLPSYYNGIFHSLSLSYSQSIYALTYKGVNYQMNVGERVSYIGYTVIALAAAAMYFDYKRNRLKNVALWLVFGIVFAWLSLGPYVQFGSYVSGIPTIYSLYRLVPVLNIIREPGRFDMIFTICLAMLAAFGFQQLTYGKDGRKSFMIMAAVSVLILIEYNGMPLSSQFASQTITSTQIPVAYSQIGKISGNFSVLVLPALPNQSDEPAQYMGQATYYVSALKKPIIGGYTSRENATESISVSAVPLVQTAQYLELGYGLIYPSPISEDPTNLTLLSLANYNTAFIAVQLSAYNTSSKQSIVDYLAGIFGQPVYLNLSDNTSVFSTEAAISKYAGKSLTAYTVGNWTPGYQILCNNPYEQCNQALAEMWWGPNPRTLILVSPKTQGITLSFDSLSIANGTVLGVYLGNTEINQVRLSGSTAQYSVNMTVPQGYSEIAFYSQESASSTGQIAPFGIDNITFTAK